MSHKGDLGESRKVELLTTENQKLVGQVSRLEERIAVWNGSPPTPPSGPPAKSTACVIAEGEKRCMISLS